MRDLELACEIEQDKQMSVSVEDNRVCLCLEGPYHMETVHLNRNNTIALIHRLKTLLDKEDIK